MDKFKKYAEKTGDISQVQIALHTNAWVLLASYEFNNEEYRKNLMKVSLS